MANQRGLMGAACLTAAEYERLESLGVRFTQPPVDYGTAITAVFDDTCGNLIQITQEKLGS